MNFDNFTDALMIKIMEKVHNNPKMNNLIQEKIVILPYFLRLPIYSNMRSSSVEGEFPIVVFQGDSGRVYFFALRTLLTDKEITEALAKK